REGEDEAACDGAAGELRAEGDGDAPCAEAEEGDADRAEDEERVERVGEDPYLRDLEGEKCRRGHEHGQAGGAIASLGHGRRVLSVWPAAPRKRWGERELRCADRERFADPGETLSSDWQR